MKRKTTTKSVNFVAALLCLFNFALVGCAPNSKNTSTDISVIEHVEQYSRISTEELKEIMGEPVNEEEWTNKTSKGDFLLTTLSYDKNSCHYEFIIADDSVVRLSIYSEQYWYNKGDRFTFSGKKEDIYELFDITIGKNVKKVADNPFSFKLSPVNDKIAVFNVQDIDNDTFGFVKITYNLNYFD